MTGAMSSADRLREWNVRAMRRIALLGLASLVVIAFATIADVLARWLLSAPFSGVYDLSTLFIAVAMAACFPAALAQRRSITVTFFADALPARLQAALIFFADAVTLIFFALLAWQMAVYTAELAESGETTFILELPVAPWWVATSALFILCVPVQALVTWTAFLDMVNGRVPDAGPVGEL